MELSSRENEGNTTSYESRDFTIPDESMVSVM